jgi:hypothetical protein
MPMMADVEILAEDAAQIAAGKEYRPGAPAADQDALLAEVRADGTDDRPVADAAEANLIVGAVYLAPTRTECAGVHGIP